MSLRTLILCFLGTSFLLFTSCKKEDDCVTHTGLNGEWTWVSSSGGFGGWTLTPESENLTRRLEIDDFYYREYVNDTLAIETQYDLGISEEALLGTPERTFIELATGQKYAIIIGTSTLDLFDQCFDCYHHQYERD